MACASIGSLRSPTHHHVDGFAASHDVVADPRATARSPITLDAGTSCLTAAAEDNGAGATRAMTLTPPPTRMRTWLCGHRTTGQRHKGRDRPMATEEGAKGKERSSSQATAKRRIRLNVQIAALPRT